MKLDRLGEFRVLTLRETMPFQGTCANAAVVADYFNLHIATDVRHNAEVESFYILLVSTRRKVLGHCLISTGTLDCILVHPREVFRPAIVAAAAAIILIHNHPSGDPSPSEADIKVTRDLARGGQLLKIDVLDHVVMGRAGEVNPGHPGYVSLRELGYLNV